MKLKSILLAVLATTVLLAKDITIPFNELPKNTQEFIFENFGKDKIALAKKDRDSYEVVLKDGTEIDFMLNGEWKELDGKHKALPYSILPLIMEKISATESNAQILELSKKTNGYKFKLSNGMEIYTDTQGNILRKKLD
ncbi:PepSY-like domain-containing protein [Campylobacter sp. VicNov18]|uniref:PepSY-like domain-containing protein n=1 Tax=Campylobacter bilis TaxID=2691918 RepID=UPI00130EC004|nr:PepSY-like domain-containing protein [Campylobacter bilis]MPV63764.1 hypothetical protein [Campylobacter hepaticus]MBM0637265.1 hypothetical protein [Campylobacter bilis]MCC8277984.1 PepSY-like domain-containing protein [Campylobacter bilis]MCC8299488.1 PepSY-like domain-containing protein [Campylobacter bilis]MCC8300893.1 PepSY-like domain-containing protein [Campylobacter bilis]